MQGDYMQKDNLDRGERRGWFNGGWLREDGSMGMHEELKK